MKMERGELVGNPQCLGYEYDYARKKLVVNPSEAETVKYIFNNYVAGMGATNIAKQLTSKNIKTKQGKSKWHPKVILEIIRNEKYIGTLVQGKSYILDPLSKKRIYNTGEKDMYIVEKSHEAIIDVDIFNLAQEILSKRTYKRSDSKRNASVRSYPFSGLLKCSHCGSNFIRKYYITKKGDVVFWKCATAMKKGKQYCPNNMSIRDRVIQQAFVVFQSKARIDVCKEQAHLIIDKITIENCDDTNTFIFHAFDSSIVTVCIDNRDIIDNR